MCNEDPDEAGAAGLFNQLMALPLIVFKAILSGVTTR
jgi:hypothetical protein